MHVAASIFQKREVGLWVSCFSCRSPALTSHTTSCLYAKSMEALARAALFHVDVCHIAPQVYQGQKCAMMGPGAPQAKRSLDEFVAAPNLDVFSVSGASRETLLVLAEGVRGLAKRSEATVAAQQGRSAKVSPQVGGIYGPLCPCLHHLSSVSNAAEKGAARSCAECGGVMTQLPPFDSAAARAVLSALEAAAASQPAGLFRPCPSVLQLLLRSAAAQDPSRFTAARALHREGQWTVDRVHAAVLRRARLCAPGESWLVPLSVDVTLPAAAAGLPSGLSAGAAAAALPRLRGLFLWDACDDGTFSPLQLAAVAVRETDLPPALAILAANEMARQLLDFRDSLKPEPTALRAALARAFTRVAMLQQTADGLEKACAAAAPADAVGSAPAAATAAIAAAAAIPASLLARDAAAIRASCTVPLPELLHLPPLLLPQAAATVATDDKGAVNVGAPASAPPAAAGATLVIRAADLFDDGVAAAAAATLSTCAAGAGGNSAALPAPPASASTAAVAAASSPAIVQLAAAAGPQARVERTRLTAVDPTGRPPWAPAVVAPPQLIAAWLTAREIDLSHTPVQRLTAGCSALSGGGSATGPDAARFPLRPVCHCFASIPVDVTAEGEVAEPDTDAAAATAAKAGAAGAGSPDEANNAATAGACSGSAVPVDPSTSGVGLRRPRPRTVLRAWRWRDSVRLPLAELLPGPMRDALPPCEACGAVRASSAAAASSAAGAGATSASSVPSGTATIASVGLGLGNPIVRYADGLVLSKQLPPRMHAPVVAALAGAVNGFLADIASLKVALPVAAPTMTAAKSTVTLDAAPESAGSSEGAAAKRRRDDDGDVSGAPAVVAVGASPSGAPAARTAGHAAAAVAASVSSAFRGLQAAIPASTDVTAWVGSDGIPCLAVAGMPLELL